MPSAYSKATLSNRHRLDDLHAQRLRALNRGNSIRTTRAAIKREVKAGATSAADLVAEPPTVIKGMSLFDLLMAAPKWGRYKTGKTLLRLHIDASVTVGGLNYAERARLVADLDGLL